MHYEYLSLKDITDKYPFTMPMLRRYLFERRINGLWKACRKVGTRWLVRSDLFDEWIESKSEKI